MHIDLFNVLTYLTGMTLLKVLLFMSDLVK
jgi:hypothetical protein